MKLFSKEKINCFGKGITPKSHQSHPYVTTPSASDLAQLPSQAPKRTGPETGLNVNEGAGVMASRYTWDWEVFPRRWGGQGADQPGNTKVGELRSTERKKGERECRPQRQHHLLHFHPTWQASLHVPGATNPRNPGVLSTERTAFIDSSGSLGIQMVDTNIEA